ncbi:MAG: CopD family protein [Dehalococcoidia bacterium]|nr:CopD family protein [Dehalococcoidia bacterium]
MSEAITPWIHIVAVTVWLGPQFFMFLVTMPALRAIDDAETRVRVMRIVIYRFGWLAWAALGVIILSGMSNLFQEANEPASHVWETDYRYFQVFSTKMLVVGVAVLLTAVHTFIIGPRQLRLHEEERGDSAEALRLRRISVVMSALVLLASVAAVFLAALLANHDYSFAPV